MKIARKGLESDFKVENFFFEKHCTENNLTRAIKSSIILYWLPVKQDKNEEKRFLKNVGVKFLNNKLKKHRKSIIIRKKMN